MVEELFARNLEILKEYQPDLALALQQIEATESKLISIKNDYNIDLGHIDFYNKGAKKFTNKQFNKFKQAPQRVELGWPTPMLDNSWKAQQFRTEITKEYIEKGIKDQQVNLDDTGEIAIILGLGLGFHIDKFFSTYETSSIYVAEQYLEFVYHALHIHDVKGWYEKAKKRNGRFIILIGDDANSLLNNIFTNVKFKDFGVIDGLYFYQHYDSLLLKQIKEMFDERISTFAANPGFFEDELVMMTNCFANITGDKFWNFSDKIFFNKKTPAFIAGAGPSLDQSIEFIRENRDNLVLFSTGSSLSAILNSGLKPDFHAETENDAGPPKFIGKLAEKYDLSDIILIAPNTVHPMATKFFKRKILFFRDAVTSTKFFGKESQEIYSAVPTVSNTAARIAIGLGFKDIYLAGIDFGARNKNEHHSKKTMYYDDGFMEENPAHKQATIYNLEVSGNFGGIVYTNLSFLNAAVYLSSLYKSHPLINMFNLSDGIKILGAVPKLPETLEKFKNIKSKNREMEQVIALYDKNAAIMDISQGDINQLRHDMAKYYQNLRAAINGNDDVKYDIIDFYNAIYKVVYSDGSTIIKQTIEQFNVGTVLMYFQTGFQMIRRLKKEQRKEFFNIFKEKFLKYIDQMAQESDDFLNDMIEKIEKTEIISLNNSTKIIMPKNDNI